MAETRASKVEKATQQLGNTIPSRAKETCIFPMIFEEKHIMATES